MSNEPKAGMNLDPELLAAYIDQRLTPEQRAAVEAELAKDPDSYAVLVETMKVLDEIKVPQVPKAPKVRWMAAAGVLATVAAIVLVVRLQPDLLQRIRGEGVDPRFEQLVAASGEARSIEARLTGGFSYAPLRPVTRGNESEANLSLLAAAGELQRIAREHPQIENLHASAIGLLLSGRIDDAIDLLERVDTQSADAHYRSDLAAAYATRAQQQGRADDWTRSLNAAERAIALDGNLIEAWFNRALALQGMSQRERAVAAWQEYLRRDPNSGWAAESKARLGAVSQ